MEKRIPRIRKDFHSIEKETTKAIYFVDFDGKKYWIPKSICTLIKKKKDRVIATLSVFKFEEIEEIKVEKLDNLFVSYGSGKAKDEFIVPKLELLESRNFPLLHAQKKQLQKAIQLRYFGLFFDTGTGKTLSSLTIANTRQINGVIDNILIFVPASLKSEWQIAIYEYFPNLKNYEILSIQGTSFDSSFENIQTIIANYRYDKTQLIVDESHLAKNQSAKRSRRMYHSLNYKYAMILTATPVGRNAGDLFYQFGIMNKAILGFENYSQFSNNFLLKGGSDGEKVVALKNTKDLSEMISPYMFHLKKSDVMKVPKRTYNQVFFEMSNNQRVAYKKIENLILEYQDKNGWMPDKKAFTFTTLMQKITSGFIPCDDDLQGFFNELGKIGEGAKNLAKVKEVVFEISKEKNKRLNELQKIVEQRTNKIVVFFKYLAEKDSILELYPDSAVIDGATKNISKLIEDFKTSNSQLMLINQAMATGFNLQFIQEAVYFTTTFDLIARKQSEDRIFGRIGGLFDEVKFIDLIAKGTIDERIQDVLSYKIKIANIF